MKTGAFAFALIIGGIALAQPPKTPADVAWLWASTPICKDGQCSADIAWLWASIPVEHPADLPPKDGCQCGKDCLCCAGECTCKNRECKTQTPAQRYAQLRERAVKEGKPLLVFVGCEPVKVDGVLSLRYDGFSAAKAPAIVVGRPEGKDLYLAAELDCKTSPDVIKTMAFPPKPMPLSASR